MGGWDVILLSETWMEEKKWQKIKRWLPKNFVWRIQGAKMDHKKGRSARGIISGVRIGIEEESCADGGKEVDGCVARRVKRGEDWV